MNSVVLKNDTSDVLYIGATTERAPFMTISGDGVLTLGPNITWDEAAECLLDALERQIGRRIVAVQKATP